LGKRKYGLKGMKRIEKIPKRMRRNNNFL